MAAARKRSTRSSTSSARSKPPIVRTSAANKRSASSSTEDGGSADKYEDEEQSLDDDEAEGLDSDALDDDDEVTTKRKRTAGPKRAARKGNASPRKKRKTSADDQEDDDEELELREGQQVVGRVVQAPKTGRVPPGEISQNTFDFLAKLRVPECNDREWFKLQEPIYRQAEKEWKDFVDEFTSLLIEVDDQIPPLPPKDVIHRIYRDVRFSNDKTPYKTNFSASFSRSGRKGIFACYHVSIKPGGTILAAGVWCPAKRELDFIRAQILRSPARLRGVLENKDFVKFFGHAKPSKTGERQSIFGREGELKNAPKGVDKNHKDIDLLKCRSFAVVHQFLDSEVLDPNFRHTLCKVVEVVKPFVHCLNDMMTIPAEEDEDAGDSDNDAGDDED